MKNKIFKYVIFTYLSLLAHSLILAQVNGDCPWIKNYLTPIADFPQPGVQFQWYANLLKDPKAFRTTIQTFAKRYKNSDLDAIVAIDSRGFILGAALAYELEMPFVIIRKPGKLPRKVERIEYSLEYGKASLEIEVNSLVAGDRVIIIDDVLATGGTARAAKELVERIGGLVVEAAFLIELPFLKGRERVDAPVYSLIEIDTE